MKKLFICLAAVCLLWASDALACTTAAVTSGSSRSGRPMLWKQRDTSDPYNRLVHVSGGTYAYTSIFSCKDTLCTEAYAGINEVGFAIINNMSYNIRPDELGFDDTQEGQFMAEALASCRTVDDFERLVRERPQPRILSTNIGVMDAEGTVAYFEVSDYDYKRYDSGPEGFLYRTNFSLSGDDRGAGRVRYQIMSDLTRGRHIFDAPFFMSVARAHVRDGIDALRESRSGWMEEDDYIPRTSSVSSTVIEGPAASDNPASGLIWCAAGYPPCAYAIPVWVAAGDHMPKAVSGPADANRVAVELFLWTHSDSTAVRKVDARMLRRVERVVKRFERREFRLGRRMDARLRSSGMDLAAVDRYNEGVDRRFARFKRRFRL